MLLSIASKSDGVMWHKMASCAGTRYHLVPHLTADPKTSGQKTAAAPLLSRAERTNYSETSLYSDVVAFVNELQRRAPSMAVETFAVTNEGKDLPLVILSKPAIRSPVEAHLSGKPLVFIMANIHAGEVEGKEAAQHLIRDVATGQLGGLLDKVILLVAPIYNADGNDKIDINHRPEQNGPVGGVGVRENGQRLDLNRDFMKLEAPEARGLIANVFNRWDPHVVIDLHTTNGSYHGYALTFSPALNPNGDRRLISFVREKLLPDVSKTLASRHHYRTYFYGNFERGRDAAGNPKAWVTFDHRPRFGNNYVGLRNRLAILSEAYSYLDFRSRVDVTDKFVRAVLQYVADHAADVVRLVRDADRTASETGLTAGNEEGFGITFDKAAGKPVDILVGSVTQSTDHKANRPRLQATNEARPVKVTEIGEFTAMRRIKPPAAYILKPGNQKVIDLMLTHGIVVEELRQEEKLEVEQYLVKNVVQADRPFQGHREGKLTVSVNTSSELFPAGSFIVSTHQPKAALIFYLLEPESDCGLANWNFFDSAIAQPPPSGGSMPVFPVYRLKVEVRGGRRVVSR